ncbi:hypothetical protein DM02DRAFT_724298 [Periconia macrospinosa]|uniref:Uncharacterized protein n=1 Tax=Periconia macrospinosa TaxID=97972 RepID=A0A2V1E8Y7_9PLEO|nr:hypothetical protein DM02DRAFT_724298 [Periconia macrospinosa]
MDPDNPTPAASSTAAPPDPLPAQAQVVAQPIFHRHQKDLIILSTLPDNTSLTWRPSWFPPHTPENPPSKTGTWTLHNPPHVVTEALPSGEADAVIMTRRMRKEGDRPPVFIKTQAEWERYCQVNRVPTWLFMDKSLLLLNLGLERDENGDVCAPPTWPLYPEPLHYSSYVLSEKSLKNLPRQFHHLAKNYGRNGKRVVVYPDGALIVRDARWVEKHGVPMLPVGKHWSYIPWTREQEGLDPPTLDLVRRSI